MWPTMIVPFLIPIMHPPVRVAPPLFGWCDVKVRSESPRGKVTRFATSAGERFRGARASGRVGTYPERGTVRSYRLHGQPTRRALRRGFGRCRVVDVFLHRGQLGLDSGELVLGLYEGRRVAEGLADALLRVGAFVLGAGQVVAGLLQECRDAGGAVLDALDESDTAVEERLAGHSEAAARHFVESDGHHRLGPERRTGRDGDVEATDLADRAVVAGGVAGRPFQVGVVRPGRERVGRVSAGGVGVAA